MAKRVLGMVLAGGKGSRLRPLTSYRSKPAVPFGGIYRIIDFVLSNFANSGIRSIYVLTQFKSQSLVEHLYRAWAGTNLRPGNFIIPVPAQMQTPGELWYSGTADAIFQNLNLITETHADLVCIFGGDHIYYMDVRHMLRSHLASEADVTVSAIPVPREEASRFGVIECDESGRVNGFHEKVDSPPPMPGDAGRSYASMGNYVFSRDVLERVLLEDAANPDSSHDFGADILPGMVARGERVFAYDFEKNEVPGAIAGAPNTYWRDVGTLEAYYEASLALKEVVPDFDIYRREWPINTVGTTLAPSKFVHDTEGRVGEARQSLVGAGTIISGALVRDCVIGRNVRVHSFCEIEDSIVMGGVEINRGCKIKRAIIDKDVILERDTTVGHDHDADRARGWTVTESGITVIPKQPNMRPVTLLDL
ncbi:MAG: glucose-1-phosphate adenylyltransferase [Planctomycetota bacterium]|jgi:glucose-1-phosphate adenylyltransferase